MNDLEKIIRDLKGESPSTTDARLRTSSGSQDNSPSQARYAGFFDDSKTIFQLKDPVAVYTAVELFPEIELPKFTKQVLRDSYENLDESQILKIKSTVEKARSNPSLRGQFRQQAKKLKTGNLERDSRPKIVKKPRRKRGYDDKGSLLPTEERIRKDVQRYGEIQVSDLEEAGFTNLVNFVYRYFPNRLIFVSEGGKEYINLRKLQEIVSDPEWRREIGAGMLEIANDFEELIDVLPR